MVLTVATYEDDNGVGYPCRLADTTLAAFPSGTASTAGKPSIAIAGFSRRKRGLTPRHVSGRIGSATATAAPKYRRFAVCKKTTFDALTLGETFTVNSNQYTIVGKFSEQID